MQNDGVLLMFNKKTVFIIGAGASAEFNLPVGETLKSQIADLLHERSFNANNELSTKFRATLFQSFGIEESHKLLEHGTTLAESVESFVSIDEALHYFSENAGVVKLGKLAVAYLILEAERRSSLMAGDHPKHRLPILALPKPASATWLSEFLSMALSFARRDDVRNIFSNVSIINFNYDRVVEQFLSRQLHERAGLSESEGYVVASHLKIIRPYGSLGKLPWQTDNDAVPFGHEFYNSKTKLGSVADRIRTYAEQVDHSNVQTQIREVIDPAALMIFIGFGFHQQNLSLLKSPSASRQVFATALGIDHDNHELFAEDLSQNFGSVKLFDRSGADLMKALRPSIMAAAS